MKLKALLLLSLLAFTLPSPAIDDYQLGPDSLPQEGVPKGKITHHNWNNSKIFPQTTREYWVYCPVQYDPAKPARVMVFQDGSSYISEKGSYHIPRCLR